MILKGFLKIKLVIVAIVLCSFTFGRNISPSYTEIENLVGIVHVAHRSHEALFSGSFNTSLLWGEETPLLNKAIETITPSLIDTIGGEILLSNLLGVSHKHLAAIDTLSSPHIRTMSMHFINALFFGYCGPSSFVENFGLYTLAQILSTFTAIPGAELFNFYKVYLSYAICGLAPAFRAFVLTSTNQILDWNSPVQEPTTYWGKTRNFFAKHKQKIKIGLWAVNFTYSAISKIINWTTSTPETPSSSNEVPGCSDAISRLNKAIEASNNPTIEMLRDNSTTQMVKKTYRALTKVFHPDIQRGLSLDKKNPNAASLWLEMNEAKDFFMGSCTK